MITLAKLRRKPRHFRAFTGLTVTEFDTLFAEVTPRMKPLNLPSDSVLSVKARSVRDIRFSSACPSACSWD